jgi:hypothetical protein
MPTARTPWSACNRVLEDKWHDTQLQAHRERLEAIQSAASVSTDVLSAALAGASSPVRVHKAVKAKRAAASSAGRPVPLAKSKSPAAKSRQRQIERDNLVLINKILALDSRTRKPKTAAKPTVKPRPQSAHSSRLSQTHREDCDTLMEVQAALTARGHPCLPLPDAPRSAASHALYTRRSVGAHVGFCEQNAPALDRQAGAARRRSSAQRRILDENKKLLERILTARTTINRADWQRHEQEHRRLLGNISRHGLRPTEHEHEHERLARSRSSAVLLSGEDDVVVVGGGQGSDTRRRSRPLAASRSMPALPVDSTRPSDSVVARMRRMVLEAEAEVEAHTLA